MVNLGDQTIDAFQHFPSHPVMPPKQTFCEFLYNSKTKTIMGRTSESWRKFIVTDFFFVPLEMKKVGTRAEEG